MRTVASSPLRRQVVRALVPTYLALIAGLPAAAALLPVAAAEGVAGRTLALALAPATFTLAYVLVAGGLSRLTRRAIVAGTFPRDLGHPIYGPRRLYALCWTAVYYCTPVYHAVLAVPALKRLTLRLFGYRGAADVTLYPDSWVRDLPLLTMGEGAYVSNRATIGTNLCRRDGTVTVAPIAIGRDAMIGHLAILGPGVVIGDDAEIGVGCALGMSVSVGRGAHVGPTTAIHHGTIIGEGCDVGPMCLIGARAVIHAGVRVPGGTIVPPRATIRTEADLAAYRPAGRGKYANVTSAPDLLPQNEVLAGPAAIPAA